MKASVIGYGKVGKPMVEAFREMGHEVVAIDKVPMKGATTDYKVIQDTEIIFIIVPTPSNPDGSFSMKHIMEVAKEIKPLLKNQLIVLCSTVNVGDTRKLQKYLGCGVCYNPFFIRLGSVKEDILNPDFILIGENNKEAGDKLEKFYDDSAEITPYVVVAGIKRMSWENAELTKIAVNTFLTTKISFANNMAELCEKIKGGNIDVVMDAVGSYGGINPSRLKGGARYGGVCLPRDNRALCHIGKKYGVKMPIAEATDEINSRVTDRLIDLILKNLPKDGKVLILGATYTTNTNITEESEGSYLSYRLIKKGINFHICDPTYSRYANDSFSPSKIYIGINTYKIADYDILVIATPWECFKTIKSKDLKPNATIIDCWRILDGSKFKNYIALGVNK